MDPAEAFEQSRQTFAPLLSFPELPRLPKPSETEFSLSRDVLVKIPSDQLAELMFGATKSDVAPQVTLLPEAAACIGWASHLMHVNETVTDALQLLEAGRTIAAACCARVAVEMANRAANYAERVTQASEHQVPALLNAFATNVRGKLGGSLAQQVGGRLNAVRARLDIETAVDDLYGALCDLSHPREGQRANFHTTDERGSVVVRRSHTPKSSEVVYLAGLIAMETMLELSTSRSLDRYLPDDISKAWTIDASRVRRSEERPWTALSKDYYSYAAVWDYFSDGISPEIEGPWFHALLESPKARWRVSKVNRKRLLRWHAVMTELQQAVTYCINSGHICSAAAIARFLVEVESQLFAACQELRNGLPSHDPGTILSRDHGGVDTPAAASLLERLGAPAGSASELVAGLRNLAHPNLTARFAYWAVFRTMSDEGNFLHLRSQGNKAMWNSSEISGAVDCYRGPWVATVAAWGMTRFVSMEVAATGITNLHETDPSEFSELWSVPDEVISGS